MGSRAIHTPASRRLAEAADITGVPVGTMLSAMRTRKVCRARHYAMWLMHQDGFGVCEIAREMGGLEPSSVNYGIRRVQEQIEEAQCKV